MITGMLGAPFRQSQDSWLLDCMMMSCWLRTHSLGAPFRQSQDSWRTSLQHPTWRRRGRDGWRRAHGAPSGPTATQGACGLDPHSAGECHWVPL